MKYGRYYRKLAMCVFMMFIMALSFSSATYAWFSSNSVVQTNRVMSQSNTDSVELLVSDKGGDAFKGSSETAITQVNSALTEQLMPVSTADLKNFVYQTGSVEAKAVHFTRSEGEYYYHGRIFLRADATNHDNGEKLALYLDESEEIGPFFRNTTGNVLNAVRLGLAIEGEEPLILKISEDDYSVPGKNQGTVLNGVELGANQVIDSSEEVFKAVDDPAVLLGEYLLDEDAVVGENSAKPLCKMDLNRIYTLDIYVYLEGCDPDCSEALALNSMDFYLAFYGVLVEEDS